MSHIILKHVHFTAGDIIALRANTANNADKDLIKRDMKEIKNYIQSGKISTEEARDIESKTNDARWNPRVSKDEIAIDATKKM